MSTKTRFGIYYVYNVYREDESKIIIETKRTSNTLLFLNNRLYISNLLFILN